MPKPIGTASESPPVNFVWVGPPRFGKGGQDVMGPETLDANFKKFGDRSSQNPMTFWCQEQYKEMYVDYFKEKGIDITVQAIESSFTDISKPHAMEVASYYSELGKETGSTLDKVYFKDMFFQYLLATQGGYVMDTGMYASTAQPVNCQGYDRIKFPTIQAKYEGNPPDIEVWMLYAPEHSEDAKDCLDVYLDEYKQVLDIDEEFRHFMVGHIAVEPYVHLLSKLEAGTVDDEEKAKYVWHCPPMKTSTIKVDECGITKLYLNSHRNNTLNKLYCAVIANDDVPLRFMVHHTPLEEIKFMVNQVLGVPPRTLTVAEKIAEKLASEELTEEFRDILSTLLTYSEPKADFSAEAPPSRTPEAAPPVVSALVPKALPEMASASDRAVPVMLTESLLRVPSLASLSGRLEKDSTKAPPLNALVSQLRAAVSTRSGGMGGLISDLERETSARGIPVSRSMLGLISEMSIKGIPLTQSLLGVVSEVSTRGIPLTRSLLGLSTEAPVNTQLASDERTAHVAHSRRPPILAVVEEGAEDSSDALSEEHIVNASDAPVAEAGSDAHDPPLISEKAKDSEVQALIGILNQTLDNFTEAYCKGHRIVADILIDQLTTNLAILRTMDVTPEASIEVEGFTAKFKSQLEDIIHKEHARGGSKITP